jgi:hypothetical protein
LIVTVTSGWKEIAKGRMAGFEVGGVKGKVSFDPVSGNGQTRGRGVVFCAAGGISGVLSIGITAIAVALRRTYFGGGKVPKAFQ